MIEGIRKRYLAFLVKNGILKKSKRLDLGDPHPCVLGSDVTQSTKVD